ncbi:hypothetical protein TNCV_3946091 [Trichonephila clavipes]|nr:hypothetical protein TNCV_3946091 [Trichonephila clavipes]
MYRGCKLAYLHGLLASICKDSLISRSFNLLDEFCKKDISSFSDASQELQWQMYRGCKLAYLHGSVASLCKGSPFSRNFNLPDEFCKKDISSFSDASQELQWQMYRGSMQRIAIADYRCKLAYFGLLASICKDSLISRSFNLLDEFCKKDISSFSDASQELQWQMYRGCKLAYLHGSVASLCKGSLFSRSFNLPDEFCKKDISSFSDASQELQWQMYRGCKLAYFADMVRWHLSVKTPSFLKF